MDIKMAAYIATHRALSKKELIRPGKCPCGIPYPDAHHADYSKPLEIIWLCPGCHRRLHEAIKSGKINSPNFRLALPRRYKDRRILTLKHMLRNGVRRAEPLAWEIGVSASILYKWLRGGAVSKRSSIKLDKFLKKAHEKKAAIA